MKEKFLIPVLSFLLFFASSCKDVKEPEFRRIDNFGLRKASLQEATIGFNVTYFNPNNFGVTVKEAGADVYVDSIYLGKFSQDQVVEVSKNSEFSIPFSGAISLQKVLGMDLKSLASKEVLLRANGSAKIGKAGIFVTKPINYQGRHRLDEINLDRLK